jgi:hypothetical protein
MWPDQFRESLAEWNALRDCCKNTKDLEQMLHLVNDWWFRVPIVTKHLHPMDVENWPNPWELLSDNLFCELARAVGIVYTLMCIDRPELGNIEILVTDEDNLVRVCQGKYTLNWAPMTIVNNLDTENRIKYIIDSQQLKNKINE